MKRDLEKMGVSDESSVSEDVNGDGDVIIKADDIDDEE